MEDDPYVYDSVPFRERKRVTFNCCDVKNAEIDRLRAELASRQIDIDTFLATARQENEEFRSEYGELEVKLENCEAELAEAKARIAELEAYHTQLH